jgi:hypothetical protein
MVENARKIIKRTYDKSSHGVNKFGRGGSK